MIQQLWMRWWLSPIAEIVRSADNPLAEEMMPKSVHNHPPRERVVIAQQVFGELPASTAVALIR